MCKNTSTDRTKRWREKHRRSYNRYMRGYRTIDIGVLLCDPSEIWFEKDARKRRLLKRATPRWVDGPAIRQLYQECINLNQQYPGLDFVVHHTIPISHPNVCGLHVIENMEIVSSSRKKQLGRKFYYRQSD